MHSWNHNHSITMKVIYAIVMCQVLCRGVLSDTAVRDSYVTSDSEFIDSNITSYTKSRDIGVQSSISELPIMSVDVGNLTAWQTSVSSKMAWLSGLFDHHEWEAYLSNVTEPCAEDIRTYVTALNAGTLWASKMYDASGQYNHNLMFGNEYWLGSLNGCRELERRQYHELVPPYRVAYHVSRFNISLPDAHVPQSKLMLLGSCLPASCGAADILRVLNASARVHVARGHAGADVLVQAVRPVPGPYVLTQDLKFLILGSVVVLVGSLIVVASFYEGWLERCERRARSRRVRDLEMSLHNNNIDQHKANNNMDESVRQRVNGVKPPPPASTPATPSAPAAHEDEEYQRRPTTGVLSEILLSFSVLSNGRKIVSTNSAADGALTCLHGMRFLSVIWVIMVHTYLTLFYISDNKTLRTVIERNFLYQSVGNASYSVDTFFFISGLLVTILFLRAEDKKHNNKPPEEKAKNGYNNPALSVSTVSIPNHDSIEVIESPKTSCISAAEFMRDLKKFLLMVFYRLIRLTPAYAFIIGVNELTLRYSHNNSVFEPAIFDHITCDLFWWRNLLYINNLYPQREMCMVWSWYMANDTQFYAVGLLLLLISLRSLKLSIISMSVLMVSSWVTTIAISYSYQYKARIQDPFEMFDPLYDKPWSRLGPYLVGMAVGWYLHRTRCQVRIPLWLVIVGWPVSIAIFGLIIFGMVDGYFEVWPTAFYVSVGHTAWGVALAWITIACCCGYGGLVNSMLSYRGALPLSRLTYCAYLIHPTIMMYTSFLMDGPIHLQNSMVLVTYAGYAVCSFLASFAISVAFEAPIIRLMKIGISGPAGRTD